MNSRRVGLTLGISGGLGLMCGLLLQPSWQDVIEPAQVMAGLVTYPSDNPVFLYSTRTWTLLHQLTALALSTGLQERTLALWISGGLGMVSFQALGLTTLAMGAPTRVAALAPLLIYVAGATRFLPGYPVELLGWPYTYGILSHALLLMLLALLALRRDRAAAVLLGLFPAIHLGVGLWAWLIVGILAITYRDMWARRARPAAAGFGVGLALTLVSAAIHVHWFLPPVPPLPEGYGALMDSIRQNWDLHRQALDWSDWTVLTAAALPPVCLVWQRRFGQHLPEESRIIATGLVIAVGVAVGADLAIGFLPDSRGAALARLMPRRLLALPLLAGVAWIIGLTSSTRVATVRVLSTALFGALTALHLRSVFGLPVPRDLLHLFTDHVLGGWATAAGAILGVAVLILTLSGRLPATWQRWCAGWPDRGARRAFHVLLVVNAVLVTTDAVIQRADPLDAVRDRTTDSFLAAVSARPGLLLTASDLHLVQARTRRSILLDGGAIDGLVYAPAAAGVADRIAREVYGQSLRAPAPDDWGVDGTFPPSLGYALWSGRSTTDWQAVGAAFGVTDILTPADWQLDLPLVDGDDQFSLWTIPVR